MNSLITNGAKIKLFCSVEKKWNSGIITSTYDGKGICAVKFSDENLNRCITYNLNKYKYCIMKNTDDYLNRTSNDVYEVEAVTEKHFDKAGKMLYRVKWKGYSDVQNTWEPVEHLQSAIKLVELFENSPSLEMKNTSEIETFEPLALNMKKCKWLLYLYDILSNPETQRILRWIDSKNFEITDIETFTSSIMKHVSRLFTAKIYFIRLQNYGFKQMPLTTIIHFTNHNFTDSDIQLLHNVGLSISYVLFCQNRFFKFKKKKNSMHCQRQNNILALFIC